MSAGKKLERKLKSISITILRSLLKSPAPVSDSSIQKILFIRYGGLGDMILSLPVFNACRSKYPAAQIDVLCDKKNSAPIEDNVLIDNIYFYEKNILKIIKLIRNLRRKKYNYVCNLIVYPSLTFGLLVRLAAPTATRSCGDQKEFGFFYNRLISLPSKKEIHMLNRLFLLSSELTGDEISCIETPWINFNKSIEVQAKNIYEKLIPNSATNKTEPKLVFINLSAGLKRREWTEDKFIDFLRLVKEKYRHKIDGWAIFTFPNQPEKSKKIVEQVNDNSVVQIPLIKNFRVVMELLKRCYLLISPDTAFVHAASAMGTPVLDLIIGENAITWAPVGVENQIVVSEDVLSLQELTLDKVVNGFDNLLDRLSS